MIQWLSEKEYEDEDEDAIHRELATIRQIIDYSDYFSEYLKIRSSSSVMYQQEMLSSLLRTNDGETPVYNAVVEGIDGEKQSLLQSDESIDEMLDILKNFSAMLKGEPNNFLDREEPEGRFDHDR